MNADQLKKIFPNADPALLDQTCKELGANPAAYGLDTPLRLAHFFAQVRQESGAGFTAQVENLNYKPAALIATFGYYGSHKSEAEADGRQVDPATGKVLRAAQQEVIANKAYGGKYGNGDIASGDGWRYRGRGFLQITFRDNYAATNKRYHQIYPDPAADLVADPSLLERFPYNLRSAVCFWLNNGLDKKADAGSAPEVVDSITRVINSKTDSYDERRAHFVTAFNALR